MESIDESVKEATTTLLDPIPEEIGQMVELIKKLQSYPDSTRLFKELHDLAYDMIQQDGPVWNLIKNKKTYSYASQEKDVTFYAIYYEAKDSKQSFMTIEYRNNQDNTYLNVTLERQLVAITTPVDVPLRAFGRIDKAGLMDLFLKGYKVFRGIGYFPKRVVITNGKNNTEHAYNLHPDAIPLR